MTATVVCTPVVWMVVELDVMDAEGSNCGRKVTWQFECVKQSHIQQLSICTDLPYKTVTWNISILHAGFIVQQPA
jgi:hypothetical protein